MVKKSEINKKGRLAKSTLSVVLAASMVLTSSSFVWASPADITVISENDTDVTAVEGATEVQVLDTEEQVGAATYERTFTGASLGMLTKEFTNESDVAGKIYNAIKDINVAFEDVTILDGSKKTGSEEMSSIMTLGRSIYYTVTITDSKGKAVTLTGNDDTTIKGLIPTANGTYTIKVTGTGIENSGYIVPTTSSVSDTYTIKADIASAHDVTLDGNDNYDYTGNEIRPAVTSVKINGVPLAEGTDYQVGTYGNNTDVGTAYVNIEYMNDYQDRGTQKKEFTIAAASINNNYTTVTVSNSPVTYNGKEQTPEVTVTTRSASTSARTLVKDKDYTVSLSQGTAKGVGTYDVVVTGKGNYKGAVTDGKFVINPKAFNSSTITVESPTVSYSGAGKPYDAREVVKDAESGVELERGIDYKIEYYDAAKQKFDTNVVANKKGTYAIKIISEKGNYGAGEIAASYTVADTTASLKDFLGGAEIKYTKEPEYVPGGVVPASIKIGNVTYNADGTTSGTGDINYEYFKVVFPDKEDCDGVGTYNIQVIGQDKWLGQSENIEFKVVPKDKKENQTLSGAAVYRTTSGDYTAAVEIKDGSYTLVNGVDYDLAVSNGSTSGTKKVTLTYKGNYKGSAVQDNISITAGLALTAANITAEVTGTHTYTGKAVIVDVKDIVIKETNGTNVVTLKPDEDFVISKQNTASKVGKGQVTVEGKGGFYIGTRTIEFDIVASETEKDNYSLDTKNLKEVYDYTGQDIPVEKDIIVKTKAGTVLSKGTDYTVEYFRDGKKTTDYKSAGNITVEFTITKIGVKLEASYRIATDLKKVTKLPSFEDAVYTGAAIEPEVKLTVTGTTISLVKDKDYTVAYDNNTNVGTAVVTIQGIGDYYGKYVETFKITGKDISKASVAVDGTYAYTGSAIIPKVIVKDGDVVIDPANYDVTATDNTNAGTAKVTVTGKGGYTGTTEAVEFTIAKGDQKLAVSKAITDALKIRNTNANTYTLKVTGAGTALSYVSSNTKIATVSSDGKLSFKHVCGKATITVTAAADDNHNAATLKVAVAVKPATPKITVTARTKGFNVTATAVKDITGYQVGYSRNKDFEPVTKKLVKTTKSLDKNFAGLSSKKGYYVRVRAYKKVGSTVYWGNWTSAKKITTK